MSGEHVVLVPGFLPSTCGFRFSNFFPNGPVLRIPVPGLGLLPIGDAARGLCGGMIFSVRDYFDAQRAIPDLDDPPDNDSPLFRYLVRRLGHAVRFDHGRTGQSLQRLMRARRQCG